MKLESEQRVPVYRFMAYLAISIAVVTVLSVCITLPIIYNYIHHIKRTAIMDINFCKVCPTLNDKSPIYGEFYDFL
ncbi:hypothetical protein Y032_0327g2598 [Ancylostoma ceylanicum]|uniref:Nematode cuticle collagen N-terminal domain-containing protein n=1 Tax=Ancylostoma ceylanicum TaxID=53326 RepID=A0A016S0K2_9BILA|nr:hypothetical protein Y032_0327g2598 [Ancylostoma ceylanicum]